MRNFDYHNPTHIVFGKGRIADLANLVPADARVLLLYGGGSIKANGTYDEVKAALGDRTVFEFGGIEANPTYGTLMKAIEIVRKEKVDFLLPVGGGSVGDGAKFIAAGAPYAGDPWDIMGTWHSDIVKTAIPIGLVLTLPATGTESNANAVISRPEIKAKLAFGNAKVYPRFSILDPEKTYSMPPRQVANGVIDSFVHVMEQYMTYPAQAEIQDRWAEGILQTLIEVGPKALATPTDYDVRANLMWAATVALNGLIGVGVPQDWATHGIGHELTALYGLDHAQTLAVILPSLLNNQRETKRAKLLQYGARVWGVTEGSEDERIDATIAKTRGFFETMGCKTRLAEYGIGAEASDAVKGQLEAHGALKLGEKGGITPEVAKNIVAMSV